MHHGLFPLANGDATGKVNSWRRGQAGEPEAYFGGDKLPISDECLPERGQLCCSERCECKAHPATNGSSDDLGRTLGSNDWRRWSESEAGGGKGKEKAREKLQEQGWKGSTYGNAVLGQ